MNQSLTIKSRLTARQKKFAEAYVALGSKYGAATEAIYAAGYSPSNRETARVMASELMKKPHVLQAIRAEADYALQAGVGIATETLISLAMDSKPEVRLKAATELLDRGGMAKVRQVEHLHSHRFEHLSDAELLTTVKSMADQLGVPLPAGLLPAPDITEAEFEELETEPDPLPIDGLAEIIDSQVETPSTDDQITDPVANLVASPESPTIQTPLGRLTVMITS